jgi:hypothetical protein
MNRGTVGGKECGGYRCFKADRCLEFQAPPMRHSGLSLSLGKILAKNLSMDWGGGGGGGRGKMNKEAKIKFYS